MASDPIAQAYAEALFQIAKVEDSVDEVEDELLELQRILKTNYQLKGFLDDLTVTTEGKKKAVAELFGGRLSPMTLSIVYTAVERGRHRVLPDMAEAYASLASSHRGQVTADVVTAVPMPEETTERLRAALAKLVQKQVYLRSIVDRSIIGGCIVKIGDKIIDGGLHKRLQDLRTAMVRKL